MRIAAHKTSRLINPRTLFAIALLIVAAAPRAAHSQTAPGVKTDKRAYAEPPPPALPAAGGTFRDPVFGTTIMRVTDERDGPFNVTNYSYYPSFNKDSTR
ncbi:MAG TPA: hypothetical protein VJZ26_17595, partial [Blastocatellia bacterium]|nr:hypothetical protein [Blastocatellia bacterium]